VVAKLNQLKLEISSHLSFFLTLQRLHIFLGYYIAPTAATKIKIASTIPKLVKKAIFSHFSFFFKRDLCFVQSLLGCTYRCN
jgi:hypothetical protein